MVEQYITENIGPKAVVRDLVRTAMVLSRFGPRLPQMAQDALLARANTLPPARRSRVGERLGYLAGGVLLAFVSVAVWEFLF